MTVGLGSGMRRALAWLRGAQAARLSGSGGAPALRLAAPLAFTAACAAGLVWHVRRLERRVAERQREGAAAAAAQRVMGAPRIGGHISGLVDARGAPFDSAKSLGPGTFMVLYFGFAHCPDICPMELDKVAAAAALVAARGTPAATGLRVQPVFVTLDPARDSPDALRAYLSDFAANGVCFVGVTGDAEAVRAAARQYRVYYRPARTSGAGDVPLAQGDYLLDHSTFVFVVDPDGRYVAHAGRDATPESLAGLVADAMESYAAVRQSVQPSGHAVDEQGAAA